MNKFKEKGKQMKIPKNARSIFRRCFDKQALSPVISSVIMASVVIALSFAVLTWSQNRTSDYAQDYGEMTDAEIARLNERLVVEYIGIDGSGNLKIFLLNYGDIEVRIQSVHIYNYAGYDEYFDIAEFGFHNGTTSPDPYLPIGEEGYIKINCGNLTEGKYFVTIITERRSSFDTEFDV